MKEPVPDPISRRDMLRRTATGDAYGGAYYHLQLARIYLLAGETDKSLEQLEPLRNNPRFRKLVDGTA